MQKKRPPLLIVPTIEVSGMTDPVVQIIDEANGEITYTLRISGTSFRPKIFKTSKYTIKVGQQGTRKMKTLTGIEPVKAGETEILKVNL